MRVEDIDTQRSSMTSARRQLDDLATLGLDWDGPVAYQSDNHAHYEAALADLQARGLIYECYCSRKDIQEAARAPHAIPGHYPGTCRDLPESVRASRRQSLAAQDRAPALRLRASVSSYPVRDLFAGDYVGEVDDFIIRRGGQSPDWAYNLAVVVDDMAQGVDQVVRGDDLLPSAPRQAYLGSLLGASPIEYVHVPLVLGPSGQRLAKRDGAVTLRELLETRSVADVLGEMARSVGISVPGSSVGEILAEFDPSKMPREPYVFGA